MRESPLQQQHGQIEQLRGPTQVEPLARWSYLTAGTQTASAEASSTPATSVSMVTF